MHPREVEAEPARCEQRKPHSCRDASPPFLMLDRRKPDAGERSHDPGAWGTDGSSPVAMPKITGMTAETPATGATTLIAPVSIPR